MPKKPRVIIPTDPTAVIAQLKGIREKHLADGTKSPLSGLNWEKISLALDSAATHDAAADTARREMEREFKARDGDMPAVELALRSARDVLMGIYAENPKKLGDWKFEVHDTSAAKKVTKPGQ